MRNTPGGIESRINDAEEQRRELEGRMVGISAMEQDRQKRMKTKSEDSLRDFWDSIKHSNIRILGVPEGEERKRQRTYLETK